MHIRSTRLKAALAGAAAVIAASVILPVANVAQALPPGTPSAGGITLQPATGDSDDLFSLAFSSPPQVCPGDATASYRWSTFITPLSNDPAPMIYSASGTPTGPAFTNNLADPIGTRVRAVNPGLGDGLVVAPSGLSFGSSLFAGLPPGAYNIGIACTLPDASFVVQTAKFWSVGVTITAAAGAGVNNFNYAVGVAPSAPNLTAANAGNQSCTAVFTPGAGGATSFTATANPGGFTSAPGAASPLTISGLTNGTAYTITVTGTNTVGTSAPSNSLPCTPVNGPRTNVTGLTATPGAPGSGNVALAWTAPGVNSPPATPINYNVSWTGPTPSPAGGVTVPFGTNAYSATGLATGSYVFTVNAIYGDAPTTGTPPATAAAAVSPSAVIIQDIDVVRPVGALVLTQVCSSHRAFGADGPSFGFPAGLPAVSALNPSTVGAPSATGLAPTVIENGVRPADSDPSFGEYPYPVDNTTFVPNATYPTHCGIDLGTAKFVTVGGGAGQFFSTSGVMDEITVVDTRDADLGWTVSGTMSNFSANGGSDVFSGSQLGWEPVNTQDTGPFTDSNGVSYDQLTAAGPVVQPNTPNATGLSSGRPLVTGAAGAGLGVAIADARLKLLIPVTADAGLYEGTLTLWVA